MFTINMQRASSLVIAMMISMSTHSQVEFRGINTAPNLASSFNDASLPRDSELNQPLDLLNDFYPSIEIRLENHSNIQRRSDQSESDTRLVVDPVLAYKTNLGRHAFYAAYAGSFDFHQDLDEEDSSSHNLHTRLGLDLNSRWDLDLFGSIGTAREERGVSGTRDVVFDDDNTFSNDGRDRIDFDRFGVDLIYGKKLDRVKVVLGYEATSSTFRSDSGDEILAGSRDRSSDGVHFDIEYTVGGRTSVFARVDYTNINFDRTVNSFDSDQFDWLVGLRMNATSRLSGVVGFGGTDRDFDDSSLNGFDGNNYYVNLTYALKPYSVFQLGATRSIEESNSLNSSLFVSEIVSLSWDHSFTDHLTFGSFAKLIDDDFDNDRHDEFFDYGFSLDYAARPWLTVGLYYEDIDRDSNFDDISFEDRIFGIRLKSDLRSFLGNQNRRNRQIEPSSFKPSQRSQFANPR